jgi:hypothetical protein
MNKSRRPLSSEESKLIRDLLEENYLQKKALAPNYNKIALQTGFLIIVIGLVVRLVTTSKHQLDSSQLLVLVVIGLVFAMIIIEGVFWKFVTANDERKRLDKENDYYLKLLHPN